MYNILPFLIRAFVGWAVWHFQAILSSLYCRKWYVRLCLLFLPKWAKSTKPWIRQGEIL